MSNRWRERKAGAFVSATELANRKKELLAPVQKWHKVRAQPPNPGISNYRVLKWVSKSSTVGQFGEYDDPLALDASDSEHQAPSSASSDDEEEEDDDNGEEDSNLKVKVDRKTTKAEAGGQLAGLETGETAEDVLRITGSSLLAGDSISGTATPVDPEDSAAPSTNLSALGGLDGGAASKLSKPSLQPKSIAPSVIVSRGDTPMEVKPPSAQAPPQAPSLPHHDEAPSAADETPAAATTFPLLASEDVDGTALVQDSISIQQSETQPLEMIVPAAVVAETQDNDDVVNFTQAPIGLATDQVHSSSLEPGSLP